VSTTPACRYSATAASAAWAPERLTPPPAKMATRGARRRASAARSTSAAGPAAGGGGGGKLGPGRGGPASLPSPGQRRARRDGARVPAATLPARLVLDAGRVGDTHDALAPLRRAGDGVELVVELVKDADLLADLMARKLAGDQQHGGRGGVCGVGPGRRVEE